MHFYFSNAQPDTLAIDRGWAWEWLVGVFSDLYKSLQMTFFRKQGMKCTTRLITRVSWENVSILLSDKTEINLMPA